MPSDAEITLVGQALASALTVAGDITGYYYTAVPNDLSMGAPCVLVRPTAIRFDVEADGGAQINYDLAVLAALTASGIATGAAKLDSYLSRDSAASLLALIEADSTLGGACQCAVLSEWADARMDYRIDQNGAPHFGALGHVEVQV